MTTQNQEFTPDKNFICPVEFKALPDDDGKRRVEGYASIFGNVDSYGDVVRKGAFKKTIKERVKAGLVPFVADHDWQGSKLIGVITKASEDDTGLLFEANISRAPSADDYYIKMTEGILKQTSFAFRTIAQEFPKDDEIIDGKLVQRYLTELMLLDIAPVVVAANERASITGIKSIDELFKVIETSDLNAENLRRLFDHLQYKLNELDKHTAEPVEPLTVPDTSEIDAISIDIDVDVTKARKIFGV